MRFWKGRISQPSTPKTPGRSTNLTTSTNPVRYSPFVSCPGCNALSNHGSPSGHILAQDHVSSNSSNTLGQLSPFITRPLVAKPAPAIIMSTIDQSAQGSRPIYTSFSGLVKQYKAQQTCHKVSYLRMAGISKALRFAFGFPRRLTVLFLSMSIKISRLLFLSPTDGAREADGSPQDEQCRQVGYYKAGVVDIFR